MSVMFKIFRPRIPALCLAMTAAPALASGRFTDDSAANWVERANMIIAAAQTPGLNPETAPGIFAASCRGITGEAMKYGNHRPQWATEGLSSFCSGVNVMSWGKPCREFRHAGKMFAEADPASDPADVVAAAAYLSNLSAVFVESAHDARRC
jgi:hypothetical protein